MSVASILFFSGSILPAQVTPLQPGTGKTTDGVKPLLPDNPSGSVTPLPLEEYTEEGTKLVLAVGRATIFNGNVESARKAALQTAYAEAVSRGSGIEVGRLTYIQNVKKVSDVLMTRSRGFIKSYEIVGENLVKGDPPRYEVRIEAVVVTDKALASDEEDLEGLRLYLGILGEPRILILLPDHGLQGVGTGFGTERSVKVEVEHGETKVKLEENTSGTLENKDQATAGYDTTGQLRYTETLLAQEFSRLGYQVTTSDDLHQSGLASAALIESARRGVTNDAVKVAKAVGADLVLMGVMRYSSTEVTPAGVSFMSVTAEAAMKAVVTSNGNMIDAFHKTISKTQVSEHQALASAVEVIVGSAAQTMAWKIPHILSSQNREMDLVVEGLNEDTALELKIGLQEIEGVEAVRYKTFPTKTNDLAEFILLTGYVTVELDQVINECSAILGSSIEVIEADKFSIHIKVVKSTE